MHKGICVALLAMAILSFSGAWAQEDGLKQRLEQFRHRLQDIHSQIYDLREQAKKSPSPELEQKIENLMLEAKELESQIQTVQEKYQHEGERPSHPPLPPEQGLRPWKEGKKPAEYPADGEKGRDIERQIKEKKGELEKIQQEMKQVDPKEKEYLELLRNRTLQEIKFLQQQAHQMKQREKFAPKEKGNWGQKEPRPGRFEEREWGKMAEQGKALLEELKQEAPEEFKRLMELQQQNIREFKERIHEMLKERGKLIDLQKKDPQAYEITKRERELTRKIKQLGISIKRASGAERDGKIAELKACLEEAFTLRSQIREKEIQEVEKRLEKMKQSAQKRMQNKDIIIDQRLKEMIGEGEEWDW